jgi:hypothetical protein
VPSTIRDFIWLKQTDRSRVRFFNFFRWEAIIVEPFSCILLSTKLRFCNVACLRPSFNFVRLGGNFYSSQNKWWLWHYLYRLAEMNRISFVLSNLQYYFLHMVQCRYALQSQGPLYQWQHILESCWQNVSIGVNETFTSKS